MNKSNREIKEYELTIVTSGNDQKITVTDKITPVSDIVEHIGTHVVVIDTDDGIGNNKRYIPPHEIYGILWRE